MANLQETSTWEAGIYQLETSDPVMGGVNGIDNRAPRQLANRTLWLKNELARQIALINQANTNLANQKADKTTTITAGNGLTGGGTLSGNRTLSLGTPSKITASSINTAVSNTHSHEIDKASTTVQGIVKLNNSLTSTSTTEALTANAGKILKDEITALDGSKFNLKGLLNTTDLNTLNATDNAGVWYQERNTNATIERNYPTRKAGVLLVLPSVWQGQQLYFPYNESIIYSRHVNNGNWSSWLVIGEIIDALNSSNATASLSANQGKILNETKLNITENAASATKLATARTINGVIFDGTANITITDSTKANTSTQITAGNGLTGGGTLSGNRTLSLGTPSKITATTTNTAVSNTHSHEIDKASTTVQGIVKLNNSLTSTSTTEALTAAQGKVLNDGKLDKTATAATATKLQTACQIALTGAVTGRVNFDGSGNVSMATTLTKAVVRDYTRTINGTATGQTTNTITLAGQTVVGADGRITQYFHLQHFRDFWFDGEDNGVGYANSEAAGFSIPLTLWSAMPNKILSVQVQTMRSTHATSSGQYGTEAGEHVCAWDRRKQGTNRSTAYIVLNRFRGKSSEHIDLFVTVEGY